MRPNRQVGMLTHAALDALWSASPDAAPEGGEEDALGCCPVCCAPCAALADLLVSGDLDAWVLAWPNTLPGTAWWTDQNQVDRAWLQRAWSRTDQLRCHEGQTEAVAAVNEVLSRLAADGEEAT